jgi:hypothetical protein
MGRIPGDDPHYTFALIGKNGKPTQHRIKLDGISSIANIVSKGGLIGWAWGTAVEGSKELAAAGYDLAKMGSEELRELYKEKKFSPWARTEEGAERGRHSHDVVEMMAKQEVPLEEVEEFIKSLPDAERPYAEAARSWMYENLKYARMEAAEQPVWSVKDGIAGTLDLVWMWYDDGRRQLTDWKTNKKGAVYESHRIQVTGYKICWDSMYPDKPIDTCAIAVASANGNVHGEIIEPDYDAFYAALTLYRFVKKLKKGGE